MFVSEEQDLGTATTVHWATAIRRKQFEEIGRPWSGEHVTAENATKKKARTVLDSSDMEVACSNRTRSWMPVHVCDVLSCEEMNVRGPFEKFVDWRQYAAVMRRVAVTYAKL
jgi:hypothetical protein